VARQRPPGLAPECGFDREEVLGTVGQSLGIDGNGQRRALAGGKFGEVDGAALEEFPVRF